MLVVEEEVAQWDFDVQEDGNEALDEGFFF
jgi:hypothetical protein